MVRAVNPFFVLCPVEYNRCLVNAEFTSVLPAHEKVSTVTVLLRTIAVSKDPVIPPYMLLVLAIPPETCNAPVEVEVELVVFVNVWIADGILVGCWSYTCRDIMALCETVQNNPNSEDQHIESHRKLGHAFVLHEIPSGDIIILPAKGPQTQNNPNSGDQHTENQPMKLPSDEVLVVQVIPSGDVITLAVPVLCATAQNNPNSGDQQIEYQALSVALCVTHAVPFDDVMIRFPDPPV